MTRTVSLWSILIVFGTTTLTIAQNPGNPNQVAAKVERSQIFLTSPDRYRVPIIVEPLRKVAVMAPTDSVLKSVTVPVGSTVREGQEIARLDSSGALARLKIAMANVKEMQAEFTASKDADVSSSASRSRQANAAIAEAKLDASKARMDIAQMEVESCTLRAPFNGRVMDVLVSPGQYLAKGTTILDIADVSSVRVLLPVDRTLVTVGGPVNFTIEGAGVNGKAQAVLPLIDTQATLRELVAPLSAAWVVVTNPAGNLEPGQRAQSPFLPNAPITGVPSYSLKKDDDGNTIVQVIRAERVTDVTVKVLGSIGPDRMQVFGPFRTSDALIQSSSVPLRAGTFIRFNDTQPARSVEGLPPTPDQVGDAAEVAAPVTAPARAATRPTAPAAPAATKPAAGVVPF